MEGKTPGYSLDSNIMATSGSKDIDAITLATIKLKSQEREYEIVDDPIGRIKLKIYSSDDSSLVHEKPLQVYYCSLCGAYNLVTTASLSTLKVRRTDRAIIVPDDQRIRFQRYFCAGKTVVVKRRAGLEKQWRWNCKECGVLLAYQCFPHCFKLKGELSKPTVILSRRPEDHPETSEKPPVQPFCFYILDRSLATDAAFSDLVTEIRSRSLSPLST